MPNLDDTEEENVPDIPDAMSYATNIINWNSLQEQIQNFRVDEPPIDWDSIQERMNSLQNPFISEAFSNISYNNYSLPAQQMYYMPTEFMEQQWEQKKKIKKKGKKIMNPLTQNMNNKFKIFDLVKKHFCYDEKSLKLFKYRLFLEPHIVPEYAELLKDSPDLRLRIDLPDEDLYIMDNGWKVFKQIFFRFINEVEPTYKNFRENIIIYNKQQYKLKKAIVDFYLNNFKYYAEQFEVSRDIRNELVKNSKNKVEELNFSYGYNGSSSSTMQFARHYDDDINIRFSEIKVTKKLRSLVEDKIMYALEDVGRIKMPVKKLQLVLSLNFADWLFCSTGEEWTSCMSLESSHYEAFWTGLPGMVGDKNRAMVYLTDGQKKTNYGITVDRIIARSFILTVRSKIQTKPIKYKEYFSLVKEYPQKFGMENLLKKYFKIELIPEDKNFVSKYYTEILKQKAGNGKYFACIYQDNVTLKIAKKNKAKYSPYEYGYYQSGNRGHSSIYQEGSSIEETKNIGWNYQNGLKGLIEGKKLREYFQLDRDS